MNWITPNLAQLTLRYFGAPVALYLLHEKDGNTLIDAGPPGAGPLIISQIKESISRIVLTHGHLDHIGGLGALLERWPVPVYAHTEEIPFITGRRKYGKIRPASMGHRVLSRFVPQVTYADLEIQPLCEGQKIGGLQVVHVPGHAPGMIALLHAGERVCLAADTFRFKPWGAMPMMTYDYALARESMRKVAELDFEVLCTSHGFAREKRSLPWKFPSP